MSPGLTSKRVYLKIKAQIMSGELPAGARLDPARLAYEFNASATPVRDALHQLLGERMIHAYPQQGFQVPIMGETALRELYIWNDDLLAILLKTAHTAREPVPLQVEFDADPAAATPVLFDAIAEAFGTSEHRRAVRDASDRLQRARILEVVVLSGCAEETADLVEQWSNFAFRPLRSSLIRYHRRRLAVIPQIAARMAAPF